MQLENAIITVKQTGGAVSNVNTAELLPTNRTDQIRGGCKSDSYVRHLVCVVDALVQVGNGVECETFHVLGHHVFRQLLSKPQRQLRLKILEQL